MPDTIYTGVDCCHDAERPGYDIHVTPTVVWAKPGQRIPLQAKTVTRECDPGCIYWRILSGGGRLTEEFGIAVTYLAAEEQADCSGTAQIGLFCGGKLRDVVRVAINEYELDDPAYYRAGPWHDGYYPQTVLAGQTVTDPETGKTTPVYKSTEAVIKYVPPKDLYGDEKPDVSSIFITEHTCAGKILNRNYVALRQLSTEEASGKRVLIPGKWYAINPSGLTIAVLAKGLYDFKTAKQMSLDGYMDVSVTAYIPTQYTIPPRKPTFEGVAEMEAYQEAYNVWKKWADYAKRVREITITEQSVADIRNPDMIAGGCCSPYLT